MWFHVDTIIRYSANCLFEYAQFARPLGMEELRQGLITCIIQRPGLLSRRAALLCQTSQKTKLVESPGRCSREARLWTTVVVELPSWHSKGGGFSSAALGGSAALPSGTDPRTGQRAPTQEPALLKGETCFCPGVLSSPCPGLPVAGLSWFRVAGSPALPLRVPVCFVPPDVSFHWPRASRSSSQREGRRVKRRGTDPRTGTGHRPKDRLFSGTPLRTCFSFISSRLPCSFPSSLLLYFRLCASRSGCFPATLDCSLLASSYPPFGLGKFYLHSAITVLTFLAVCEPDIYAPSM